MGDFMGTIEKGNIVNFDMKKKFKYVDSLGKGGTGKALLFKDETTDMLFAIKKYETEGESALSDRRGYHKSDEEVDELERLRRENLRLKRQLKEKDMAVELLKKVKEFERM